MSSRDVGRLAAISHTYVLRISAVSPRMSMSGCWSGWRRSSGTNSAWGSTPVGVPVRDKVHLALVGRFAARLHPSIRWRTEVPIPIPGDLRSADGVADTPVFDAIVEAETRVDDVQAVERRLRAKQRDLATRRAILLLSDTRHNRSVVRLALQMREQFPIDTRRCLAALARGADPGGDCLVIL